MKNFCLILLALSLTLSTALADDFFDSYVGVDNAWDGQKPITNKEFEDAINVLQKKQKEKEAKANKKKIKKISGGGTSLHPGLDPASEIKAQETLKSKDKEGQLLNVTVPIVIDNNILETGFYNVFGEKDKKDGKIYLSFYQSGNLCGKIAAYETNDDYDAENINFVKILPYNDNFLKIVFGSLNFNAFAYIQYCAQQ